MSLSSVTTDHNAIRSWAACRRAVPAELLPDATAVGPTGLRFLFLDGSMTSQDLHPKIHSRCPVVMPWPFSVISRKTPLTLRGAEPQVFHHQAAR